VYEPYLQATQRVLFHDAVLMQLAARFTGTAAVCANNSTDDDDNDAETALDAAEEDQNAADDLADPGKDPAMRRAREMFLEALAREQHDISELKAKMAAARAAKRKDKHDDRTLRPSQKMMQQWGLLAVPAPVMFN
jgi:hypothetical protein